MPHLEFAQENEQLADDIFDEFNHNNWSVTIRFYSLLHYVEQRLITHDYTSKTHGDRKENIIDCNEIDDKIHNLYRRLEDLSRDARYECVRLSEEDVEISEETLEEGKFILGFDGSEGGAKYSV